MKERERWVFRVKRRDDIVWHVESTKTQNTYVRGVMMLHELLCERCVYIYLPGRLLLLH